MSLRFNRIKGIFFQNTTHLASNHLSGPYNYVILNSWYLWQKKKKLTVNLSHSIWKMVRHTWKIEYGDILGLTFKNSKTKQNSRMSINFYL